jgi:hypothetical protein
MKINDGYAPYYLDKEEKKLFQKLNVKLERFARKGFYTHWFRGEVAGIPPSGDDYTDFVTRAYINYYEKKGQFRVDDELKKESYLYIQREISRESRLKINNAVRNETYYKEKYNDDYDIFGSMADKELSVRDQLIEEELNRVKEEIVREFYKYLKDEKFKMLISLFNTEKFSFEKMLAKVTDHPTALINELLNNRFIADPDGLITEEFDRIDRPCKMKLNLPLKGKRGKNHLFGILKMNGKMNKPRFIADYLGMTEAQYYLYVRKLKEQFMEFLNFWKAAGDNAEIMDELGLFQNI